MLRPEAASPRPCGPSRRATRGRRSRWPRSAPKCRCRCRRPMPRDCSVARRPLPSRRCSAMRGCTTSSRPTSAATLDPESAEDYWTYITEVTAPVVAGLARADDAARARIRSVTMQQIGAFEVDGKPSIPTHRAVIAGRRGGEQARPIAPARWDRMGSAASSAPREARLSGRDRFRRAAPARRPLAGAPCGRVAARHRLRCEPRELRGRAAARLRPTTGSSSRATRPTRQSTSGNHRRSWSDRCEPFAGSSVSASTRVSSARPTVSNRCSRPRCSPRRVIASPSSSPRSKPAACPTPAAPDEVFVNSGAAAGAGLEVGQRLHFTFFNRASSAARGGDRHDRRNRCVPGGDRERPDECARPRDFHPCLL